MPLPQVNDRLKEIPAQALRTLFASVGQLLLAADRLRARATEQLPGDGEATDAAPAQQARAAQQPPAQASPAKPAQKKPAQKPARKPAQKAARKPAQKPAQDAGTARWRSLDKTGNVRLLDGDEEQDEAELSPASALAGTPDPAPSFQDGPPAAAAPAAPEPSAPEPSAPEPVTPAPAEAIPPAATYTPTEPVPAEPAEAAAPAEPALAEPAKAAAPAEPALSPHRPNPS